MFRNKLREAGLTPPIPNARTSITLFHQIRDKLWPILTYVDFLDNGIYDYLRFRKPILKCVVVDPDGFLIAPLLDVSKFVLWCYVKVHTLVFFQVTYIILLETVNRKQVGNYLKI